MGLPAVPARLNADPARSRPCPVTGWTAQNLAAMLGHHCVMKQHSDSKPGRQ